ncbi:MAG: hypothetical protein QXI58_03935 [Candidatus Micrarchaeia archaeon]
MENRFPFNLFNFLIFFIFFSFFFACVRPECENLPSEYGQRNVCFREKAIKEKNEKICERIDDEIMKDYWCYREIAYLKNDTKICEEIKIQEAKDSCKRILSGEERFERGS